MKFDITDGKNKYEPCPGCGATDSMGLASHGGIHVVCGYCDHKGKAFPIDRDDLTSADKLAFDAWNEESRVAALTRLAA